LLARGTQVGNGIDPVRALADRIPAAEIVQALLPVQAQYGIVLVSLIANTAS
jgi:hypothetical protein